ncbi:MAG: U32 family peptidase [Bacteroidota bacterium]
MKKIELLSPAKNLECGIAAIQSGADAVYIGAPRFGARRAAFNTIEDIEKLCHFAHQYYARVFVTVNTLLFDHELEDARKMILQLKETGIDALIFQDVSILSFGIKDIPMIASTQTHNFSIEKIKFWEESGVQRVILPRELSLKEIRDIRSKTNIELEFFVHGALCVSYSGQCYISKNASGRSANRGECAQLCRHSYSLYDDQDNLLVADKHLLSLKDMNLASHLESLMDAGIDSFKIEGRLKDITYVKNVTSFYRKKMDAIFIRRNEFAKSSSGIVDCGFEPDPTKTFSRGETDFFIEKRQKNLAVFETPKSLGEYAGIAKECSNIGFTLDTQFEFQNGDGIMFFNDKEVKGTRIEKRDGKYFVPGSMEGIVPGVQIFRNHNHQFEQMIRKVVPQRHIEMKVVLRGTVNKIEVITTDEDSVESISVFEKMHTAAEKPDKAIVSMQSQFSKSGDSIYFVSEVICELIEIPFLSFSEMNQMRRTSIENHTKLRNDNFMKSKVKCEIKSVPYPFESLDERSNVVNQVAKTFYTERNVTTIETGIDASDKKSDQCLMQMRYCLKHELGMCEKFQKNAKPSTKTLLLADNKNRYRLEFDCEKCEMKVVLL